LKRRELRAWGSGLGHQVGAGVHTGEVERRHLNDLACVVVHIGAASPAMPKPIRYW
jgi:hypothetical protein